MVFRRRSFRFVARVPALAGLLAFGPLLASGCMSQEASCDNGGSCETCNADVDCESGERCQEGRCQLSSIVTAEPAAEPTPAEPSAEPAPLEPGVEPAPIEPEAVVPDGGADAGSEPDDGGSAFTDAGAVDAGRVDAGPIHLDAGAPTPDAGSPDAGVDAGPELPLNLIEVVIAAMSTEIGTDDVVRLRFNHAALVQAGTARADGKDLHLLFGGASLNRSLALGSKWNTPDTEIWFKLETEVGVGSEVVLFLAQDTTANAPDNLQELAIAMDTFDDGTLSADFALSSTGNDVVMEENNGRFHVTMSEDEADAAIVVAKQPLPADRRFLIQHRIQLNRLTGGSTMNIKTIGVVQWPERPTYAVTNNLGENVRQRVVLNHGGEDFTRSYAYCRAATGSTASWTGNSFENNYEPWGALPFDTDHIFEMESDSSVVTMRIRGTDGTLLLETEALDWDIVKHLEQADGDDQSFGDYWFYWGEVYSQGEPGGGGPYYTADFSSDWIIHVRPAPLDTNIELFEIQ